MQTTQTSLVDVPIERILPKQDLELIDTGIMDFLEDANHDTHVPVPMVQPAEYYGEIRNLAPATKITAASSWEVYGYFAEWGQCVIGAPISNTPGRDCFQPIQSPTGYERFHQGVAVTAAGGIRSGLIGGDGHAPPHLDVVQAMAHYQDPNRGIMETVLYENDLGIYAHGSITPQATAPDVKLILASALSGDWRYIVNMRLPSGSFTDGWDCLGPCMVLRPGLPLALGTRDAQATSVSAAAAIHITDGVPEPRVYTFFVSDQPKECPMSKKVTAAGTSSNTIKERLRAQLAARFADDDTWIWADDYDDTHVYFELDQQTVALPYTGQGDDVMIDGGTPQAATATTTWSLDGAPVQTDDAPADVDQLEERVAAMADNEQVLEELSNPEDV